jgi:hypothetical protein
MRKSSIFAIAVFGLSVILPVFAVRAADTLDPARLSLIQDHCTVLQTSLDQLQRRDLVARTNRGREYETVIAQLSAFSQRLRNNSKSSQALDETLNKFRTTVDAFRSNYVEYDNNMNALRQIDCRNRVTDFAVSLQRTAIMRAQVGAEVTKGEGQLAEARRIIAELQAGLVGGSR